MRNSIVLASVVLASLLAAPAASAYQAAPSIEREPCSVEGDSFVQIALRTAYSLKCAAIDNANRAIGTAWHILMSDVEHLLEQLDPTIQQVRENCHDALDPACPM